MVKRKEGETFFSKLLGQKLVTVVDDSGSDYSCNSCAYNNICGNQTLDSIRVNYETGHCYMFRVHFETKQVIYEIPEDLLEIIKDVDSDAYMTRNTKETLTLLLIESEYNNKYKEMVVSTL